jgi:trehalose 6-phosphate phosphatase
MMPRSKSASIDEVLERAVAVLDERPSALVTDVDGTLSHIVRNPQHAVVSIEIKESLRRLLPRLDLVAVVTGRENEVARRMVGVEGLTYVGSYAIDTRAAAPDASDIRAVRQQVVPFLPALPCVTLELKEVSFSLHYRNCEDPEYVRARLIEFVEPLAWANGAKIMEGKQVVEVVPGTLPDKASSFAKLMAASGINAAIFLGDDLADAAIFDEIRRRRRRGFIGLGIGVVDAETPQAVRDAADLTLDGVDAVQTFLAALAEVMSKARPLSKAEG